jgi:xanthine/CO dehydrogenase XdhC/CoxF family maturation factor
MTHEIKLLFQTLRAWKLLGKKAVFVSVVALEGSSYRRPGVRMVISDDGNYVGAVSGGCVEKEIERQAQSVFRSGKSKMMTYDGTYRIGCEGIIHILIEPADLTEGFLMEFDMVLQNRQPFKIDTYYDSDIGEYDNLGSLITMNGEKYSLHPSFHPDKVKDQSCYSQSFEPLFQLYIFGAEHDAVQLCKAASLLGWEITVVAAEDESKSIDFFPGATSLIMPSFKDIDSSMMDEQTALIVMTHSYNKDVQYLMALKDCRPAYLGLLGPVKRRERVLSMLLEQNPDTPIEFFEQIHGPAGINVGAESASEIAVSILAEILSVVRHQEPMPLKDKKSPIHG